MAYEYIGNTIPAPGLNVDNPFSYDQELLFSGVGYTQRGGTVKPGQGILPLGTVMARDTVTKQWVKFESGGSNGAGTALGILRKTVDTNASGVGGSGFQVNIVYKGSVKYNLVSSANGSNLAAAITSLGAVAKSELNSFTF